MTFTPADIASLAGQMVGGLRIAVREETQDLHDAQGRMLRELSALNASVSDLAQIVKLNTFRIERLEQCTDRWQEDTGQHHIIQVQQATEDAQWWKRWVIGTAGALFVAVATAVAMVVIQGCI